VSRIPRLSVGLPVFNGAKYIADSIEALLGQTYDDFELIISDNASTDSTPDICLDYAKSDKRIRFIRQRQNLGLAPNHNVVVDEARGEFFKWAAADDLYGRDLLKCCVEALDRYPDVVLAHSYEGVVDGDGNVAQAMKYPLATDASRPSDRFRSFLFGSSGLFDSTDPARPGMRRVDNVGILSFCDEYGVVRTAAMRSVAPLGSYHHSDRIVVCELALRGKFHITPEWLYFRRDTADRTYNVSSKVRTRCEILDPVRKNRLLHPTARLVGEYMLGYVGAIRRAPISAAEQRACLGHLARWGLDRSTIKVTRRPMLPMADLLAAGDHRDEVSARAVVAGWKESPTVTRRCESTDPGTFERSQQDRPRRS
jgi:glycosyltransferase involved in cell wall biosynthesis